MFERHSHRLNQIISLDLSYLVSFSSAADVKKSLIIGLDGWQNNIPNIFHEEQALPFSRNRPILRSRDGISIQMNLIQDLSRCKDVETRQNKSEILYLALEISSILIESFTLAL